MKLRRELRDNAEPCTLQGQSRSLKGEFETEPYFLVRAVAQCCVKGRRDSKMHFTMNNTYFQDSNLPRAMFSAERCLLR